MCLAGVIIGTYTGTFTIAGPVIQAFAIDIGLQTSQIANRSAIYGILPTARNRVNTAYMVSVFCGQLMVSLSCRFILFRRCTCAVDPF